MTLFPSCRQCSMWALYIFLFLTSIVLVAASSPQPSQIRETSSQQATAQSEQCVGVLKIGSVICMLAPMPNTPPETSVKSVEDADSFASYFLNFTARFFSDAVTKEVRDSPLTGRIASAVSMLPILLSLMGTSLISMGRFSNSWLLHHIGCVMYIVAKFTAIPVGLSLLIAGVVVGDLKLSLVGATSVSFLSDSAGARRLMALLSWTPNLIAMERWHVQKFADTTVKYTLGADDMFKGGQEAFHRVVLLAGDKSWKRKLPWTDQIVIALLATKFVVLSDAELNCCSEASGSVSIRELVYRLDRWQKAWDGQPGKWAREWTGYEDYGRSEPYETTLRFVVMLYTCVRRGKFSEEDSKKQKSLLLEALTTPRDGTMQWAFDMVRECFDKNSYQRALALPGGLYAKRHRKDLDYITHGYSE